MEREQFFEEIRARIPDFLPVSETGFNAVVRETTKNNGVVRHTLDITGESSVIPSIHLDNLYDQYMFGEKMEDILEEIAQAYLQGVQEAERLTSLDFTYEAVKDRLFVSACNAERNQEMLVDVPHEIRENLALVYRAYYGLRGAKDSSMLIHNSHLEMWGIDEERLKKEAWENMHRILPPQTTNAGQLCMEIIKRDYPGAEEELQDRGAFETDLIILTNNKIMLGAAYMFDNQIMNEMAEKLGTDLIVLPSSVNEVLLYPDNKGRLDMMKQAVEYVNGDMLQEEEFLSDEIYRYDREKQTLSVIPHEEIRLSVFPDSRVGLSEMYDYGYTSDSMLPLTKERAQELWEDLQIFRLMPDGTESGLEDAEEIGRHDGLFGVEKEAWKNYLRAQEQEISGGMEQTM